MDGSRKATRVSLWPRPPLEAYKLQLGLALGLGKHPPCKVDGTIKEGDRIGPLVAVSTPGHTPGCLSYWWPEKKALFVGDVVVSWPNVEAGWAGLTLDMAENVRSVGKLNEFSGVEYLCVGHGPPITKDAAGVLASLKKQPHAKAAAGG